MLFTDRDDAGRKLAEALRKYAPEHPVVLGLPRGGVPVAFHVAHALGAPLDVIVVRKLGVPYQRELAFGAIGEGGIRVISDDIVRRGRISPQDIAAVEEAEQSELARQAHRFRAGRPPVPLRGRTAIVIDDGIATGATAAAACEVVRAQGAARVVMAAPVAPPDAVARMSQVVDEVVCLSTPHAFSAVGQWYQDFSQTSDEEVISLLAQTPRPPEKPAMDMEEVTITAPGLPSQGLPGDLTIPPDARAVVLFAHGSGSSRHSPRNREVAAALNRAGLGTLLFDLLTPAEEGHRAHVFDIATLADRLTHATTWLRARSPAPLAYFGASTGAAAALTAAASPASPVYAVVSRGGRPDLAADLPAVRAPTLLIVGGDDTLVVTLNGEAQARLRCENRLEIVEGATHLFEEPGALEEVSTLAAAWLTTHLPPPETH